jgi:uncharacterized protein (DUF58 family)
LNKNWWSLILFVIILGAWLGHNQLLLVGLLLALVGVTSHIWAYYCLTAVTYQRRFSRTHLFFGDELELSLEIVNAKPLPLAWLIAVDDYPTAFQLLTGEWVASGSPRRRLLVNSLSLRWYERVTRHYRLRGIQRGVWQFGPVQLSSGDIFGFSIKRAVNEETQRIVVYPRYVPLTALGLPAFHPFGDYRTPRRILDDPLQLMSVREYVPGDSFRHIHWKATARRHNLQTKLFEPSASRPFAIFLDSRTSPYANEGLDRELLELGVTTAASFVHWAWQSGHPVGLYVNSVLRSSRQRIRLRPQKNEAQLQRILEAMSWMEDDGLWRISTILKMEAKSLPYGTTIVVVTAIVSGLLRQTLQDLQRQGYGVVLISLGEREMEEKDLPISLSPYLRHYHIERQIWHELETLELA